MPKTTNGECSFCICEGKRPGQHVYIYMNGKITKAGFACKHCLDHYGLR